MLRDVLDGYFLPTLPDWAVDSRHYYSLIVAVELIQHVSTVRAWTRRNAYLLVSLAPKVPYVNWMRSHHHLNQVAYTLRIQTLTNE